MHPAGHAPDPGRRSAPDRGVCGALQHHPAAQRHRLRRAGRHAGGAAGRDSRRARPQARRSPQASSGTAAAGSMKMRVTMTLPGETEAGSAGMQPCRGIAGRAHRDDAEGRGILHFALVPKQIGSVDPDALKIPARRAEYSLTENASIPFQAEPTHRTGASIHYGRPKRNTIRAIHSRATNPHLMSHHLSHAIPTHISAPRSD
jgi:hypothetical protein